MQSPKLRLTAFNSLFKREMEENDAGFPENRAVSPPETTLISLSSIIKFSHIFHPYPCCLLPYTLPVTSNFFIFASHLKLLLEQDAHRDTLILTNNTWKRSLIMPLLRLFSSLHFVSWKPGTCKRKQPASYPSIQVSPYPLRIGSRIFAPFSIFLRYQIQGC